MANVKESEEKKKDTAGTADVDAVIQAMKAAAAKEIAEAKAAAAKEIAEAKAAAAKEIEAEKAAAKEVAKEPNAKTERTLTDLEKVRAEAMAPTQVTVPKVLGSRKPYQTTVLSKGFPDYHARIPRGVPVTVPYYVAEAIREDVLQNENTEALVERLQQEFVDKAKEILNPTTV